MKLTAEDKQHLIEWGYPESDFPQIEEALRREKPNRGAYAFYALWDEIRTVADELELLSGDCRVVDAIYAANDVRTRRSTLKSEE